VSRSLPRIWIITDPTHADGPVAPIRRALEACPSDLVGVQLRATDAPDRQLVAWARELRAITSAAGSVLSVNRRPDIAQIVAADGVHLPERGFMPQDVARHWPRIEIIGVSRHDRAGLQAARREAASYAFLSPVFEVPGKVEPIGIEGFARAIADVGIPTFALGGLTLERVRGVMGTGAAGVAVRRAIYGASDPGEALRRLLRELDNRPRTGE
jgi:thiamine-phosphate pyrophosphorylase